MMRGFESEPLYEKDLDNNSAFLIRLACLCPEQIERADSSDAEIALAAGANGRPRSMAQEKV